MQKFCLTLVGAVWRELDWGVSQGALVKARHSHCWHEGWVCQHLRRKTEWKRSNRKIQKRKSTWKTGKFKKQEEEMNNKSRIGNLIQGKWPDLHPDPICWTNQSTATGILKMMQIWFLLQMIDPNFPKKSHRSANPIYCKQTFSSKYLKEHSTLWRWVANNASDVFWQFCKNPDGNNQQICGNSFQTLNQIIPDWE